MALIVGENLSIGYEGHEIINDLNFEIEEGNYVCIVGENGAGKSTLMKTILGLLDPVKGGIIFGDGLKKNEIGYLPQQTEIQRDFPASVFEIVISGCQSQMGLRPFYNKSEKKKAEENIALMGIEDLKKRCYRELSGGQQQRVLLARALCATRRILLLDEPVAGLDPKVTAEMYSIIRKLNESGITIIMITHDIKAAINEATHIIHVDKKLFSGTKEEYINSDTGKRFMAIYDVENVEKEKIKRGDC